MRHKHTRFTNHRDVSNSSEKARQALLGQTVLRSSGPEAEQFGHQLSKYFWQMASGEEVTKMGGAGPRAEQSHGPLGLWTCRAQV
jgi:hypothetical protein